MIRTQVGNGKAVMNNGYKRIEKEEISKLHFPSEEVLVSEQEITRRRLDLERTPVLGNLDHIKIKLFFEDEREKLFVETTVWAVTTDRVVLKQGVTIPIHRIFKVF